MSVWASPSAPAARNTRSLLDIMSEELAVKLQDPPEPSAVAEDVDETAIKQIDFEEFGDEDADLALALALQEMENSAYYESTRSQPTFNKIAVSNTGIHQFPSLPGGAIIQSSDRYAAEVLGQMMCGEDGEGVRFRDGVAVLRDGTRVSKHDPLLDGLANGIALTELDGVGDLDYAGLMVGNTVANDLRMFRQKKQKKGIATSGRVSAKDVSITTENVLDPSTRMIIFKLIQSGRIDSLYGIVKAGKEANVYQAERTVSPSEGGTMPESRQAQSHSQSGGEWGDISQFAVKVFKTTLNEFSNRADYVDGDQR
jgi:RIO kinase 3